jgi:drug/metabolite transporter (DMT)-like permease
LSVTVFLAVLFAAFLHASWNAWVKSVEDRFTSILRLSVGQSVVAALLVPFFGTPWAAWPWMLGSAILHTGYKIFLINAYERGDFSQIYPLARGTAPLIVALAGALFLAEVPPPLRLGAVAAIGVGILLMAGGGREGRLPRTALLLALGTAAWTASYTMVDGLGARVSGNASGFILSSIALDGIMMGGYGLVARGRTSLSAILPGWRQGLLAGGVSMSAYWISVWAFTKAPLALVAALRETSVLFAMLIAAFLLKERVAPQRWAAAALILGGIVMMRV